MSRIVKNKAKQNTHIYQNLSCFAVLKKYEEGIKLFGDYLLNFIKFCLHGRIGDGR